MESKLADDAEKRLLENRFIDLLRMLDRWKTSMEQEEEDDGIREPGKDVFEECQLRRWSGRRNLHDHWLD